MERKIINLEKHYEDGKCLICSERAATIKFKINRISYGDNVTTFNVCNNCLAQMQKEIETCK